MGRNKARLICGSRDWNQMLKEAFTSEDVSAPIEDTKPQREFDFRFSASEIQEYFLNRISETPVVRNVRGLAEEEWGTEESQARLHYAEKTYEESNY